MGAFLQESDVAGHYQFTSAVAVLDKGHVVARVIMSYKDYFSRGEQDGVLHEKLTHFFRRRLVPGLRIKINEILESTAINIPINELTMDCSTR